VRFRNETRIVWPYEVKLLDFGIAKLAAGGDEQLTQSGVIVGTPRYVSPEQARGGAIDARTDIYSLGVLTYELLVGDAPFSADSAIELMAKHIHQPPPSLRVTRPEISVGLDDLVLRMLAKDPADRPSLAECRRRLDAALDPEATVLLQVPVAPTPRPDSAVFTPPPGRFPRTERFPREPDARSHRMTPWAPRPASGARIGLVMVLGIVVVLSAVLVGAALLDSRSAARAVVERDLPATPIAPPRPAQVAPPEPEVLAPVRQKPAPHRRRAKRPATKPPAQARGPVPLR
jgi:serine/threonine-protein kinase